MGTVRKPRGYCYDKDKYTVSKFIEFVEGRRKVLKMSRKTLATELGMTEQNLGYHLNPEKGNAKFTLIQIIKILDVLEATDEDRLRLLKQ